MGSDFLFARPSFLSGFARVLDLWGRFDQYNESQTPEEADIKALVSDWLAVRRDLEQALRRVLAEHPDLLDELEEKVALSVPEAARRNVEEPRTAGRAHG